MNRMTGEGQINIALVYSGINVEYQDKIVGAIINKVKQYGYNLGIFSPFSNTTNHTAHDYGEENIFELINYDFFDAVIILPKTMTCEENTMHVVNCAKRAGVPIIAIEGDIEGCNNIRIDGSKGISDIISHFINIHNFKDFLFMGASENEQDNGKLLEYKKAITDFGLVLDEEKILYGNYSETDAGARIKEYIESGKKLPQAIICANDSMAVGVINELRFHGIFVPDDVAVTGFDGIRVSNANKPALTTIALPIYESGEMAVNIVKDVISRPSSAVMNYDIKNKFVISESCGCYEKDSADDNNLISYLYQKLDRQTLYSKRLIRMSETLTSAADLDQTFELLKEYIDDIFVDRFYICVPDKFESCIVRDNLNISNEFRHTGYPEEMNLRLCREFGEFRSRSRFKTSLMIPAFFEKSDESKMFFFTPIHFQDRSFGYICMSCDVYIGSNTLFNIWLMNLSTAIENARIREELESYSDELEKLYIQDPLTGLYNRRGLYNWAAEISSKAADSGRKIMVFVIDLDCLKNINDCFGHSEGDNALYQVGAALAKAAKNGEICARPGGDEFEVVGYDYTVEKAEEFAKSFEKALEEYNSVSGKDYRVDASWGYCVDNVNSKDDFDSLALTADKEMYRQKSAKKKQEIEK